MFISVLLIVSAILYKFEANAAEMAKNSYFHIFNMAPLAIYIFKSFKFCRGFSWKQESASVYQTVKIG